MKRFLFKKGLMMAICFIAAFLVFSAIVMTLWNAILPAVLGVKTITFVQALGILALSKILFGGFGNRGGWKRGGGSDWKNKMKEKFGQMSPEEREKFKAEWKNRCSGGMGWRMDRRDKSASASQ
jgi:hypothetical protein